MAAPDLYPVADPPAAPQLAARMAQPSASAGVGRERNPPLQRTLFPAREMPNVVQFTAYSPGAGKRTVRPGRVRSSVARPTLPATGLHTAATMISGSQETLRFYLNSPGAGGPAIAGAESPRYTNAPVAHPLHRASAAVIDLSLVLILLGMVLWGLQLSPLPVAITQKTLPYVGAGGAVLYFLFKLFWCLLGTDSPGLRFARLRLLNFDGNPPTHRQRYLRLASGVLGTLAVGLGLLWVLVDDETLSWHDQMSNTFLTPRRQ